MNRGIKLVLTKPKTGDTLTKNNSLALPGYAHINGLPWKYLPVAYSRRDFKV